MVVLHRAEKEEAMMLLAVWGGKGAGEGASLEPQKEGVWQWERRGASAVFGKPYTKGAATLIPVADVYFGRRGRTVRARPVAINEVGPDGVKIHDVQSKLPIILAGILLGGWNIYWISKTVRDWLPSRQV
jgi:hypothetical protein